VLESRRLRQFLAVYELGSIGQAAVRLLLTQPALSKSLRSLEDDLGVRLFDRTPVGVVPTVFGDALAMHAKSIEAQLREAEAAIGALRGAAKGHVVVGIGPSVAPNLMPMVALSLQRRNPGIELSVLEGLVDDLVPQLRRGQMDVIVGSWPRLADTDFATEVIFSDHLCVFARADHPLVEAGEPLSLEMLAPQLWALPPASQKWRQHFDGLFLEQGLTPPKPSVTSTSASFLKGMLREGDYLSFLPKLLVEADDASIVALPVAADWPQPEVAMSFRERALLKPPVAELVQVFRASGQELALLRP
jgi:DNA-binding transcriptional LysR family regulator